MVDGLTVVREFAWCEDACAHSLAENFVGCSVLSFRTELVGVSAAPVSALYSLACRSGQAGAPTGEELRVLARNVERKAIGPSVCLFLLASVNCLCSIVPAGFVLLHCGSLCLHCYLSWFSTDG